MLKFKDIQNIRFDVIRTAGDFQGRILFDVGPDTFHVWVDHNTLDLGVYYGRYDKKGLYQYPSDVAARKSADTKMLSLETKTTAQALAAVVAEVRKHRLVETAIAETLRIDAELKEERRQEQIEKVKKAFRDMLFASLEQGLLSPAKVAGIEHAMEDVKPESWLMLREGVRNA